MNARIAKVTGLLIAVALACGCVTLGGPGGVKRELTRSSGVELDREFGLTVNRGGIWLAKQVLKWTDEGDEIPNLKGLHKVSVGVYQVEHGPESLSSSFGLEGWTPMVRMFQEDEAVLVLTRNNKRGEIKKMVVVVASQDEWVLVKMKGRLDRVLEDAIRFGLEQADRPDLFDDVERSWEDEEDSGDVDASTAI